MTRETYYRIGLGIYALVLLAVLTYWRLPAERLIPALVEKHTRGKVTLVAEKVSPTFFLRHKLEKVSYRVDVGGGIVKDRLETLIIAPDYGNLFLGYLGAQFTAVLQHGSARGNAGTSIVRGLKKGYVTVAASDVRLEDLAFLKAFSDRNPKGVLNSVIRMKGNLTDLSTMRGDARFSIRDGALDTKVDLAGLKSAQFKSVELSCSVKEGRVHLDRAEMEGPVVSGTLAGDVHLKKEIATSLLEITARLKPGPVLENNPLASQFLSRMRKGDGPVVLRIGGTLNRPLYAPSEN